MTRQIQQIDSAAVYYYNTEDDNHVRREGAITVFPNWVQFDDGEWIPRDNVELVQSLL